MRRLVRWSFVLAIFALGTVGGFHLSSPPAEAGMICHDGRWLAADEHCQLGTLVNCTECWVWVK